MPSADGIFVRRSLAFLFVAACIACGGAPKPSEPSNPSEDSGDTPLAISGTESLGWDQEAASASEAGGLRYLVYVDGNSIVLTDVKCSGGGILFGCRSRLPALTAGVHKLQLTASRLFGGTYLESPRSPTITVVVSPRATMPAPSLTSSAVHGLLTGCHAIAVGERAGEVIVADMAGLRRVQAGAVSQGTVLLGLDPAESPVLSVAVHPAFSVTRFVYTLKVAGSAERGHRLQLVRYREVGAALGERAVLLERVVDWRYRFGRLRFDGAGRLYAGVWGRTPAPSLLLRLSEDGRVEDDSPDRSGRVPGVESMRGFDIEPGTGLLWILQETAAGVFALRTLTADGVESLERVPVSMAPGQIAVRAGAVDTAVSEVWMAYPDDRPVLLRRDGRGAMAVSARPVPLDAPIGDLAFDQSGALFGCTGAAPASGGSTSTVVRLNLKRSSGS